MISFLFKNSSLLIASLIAYFFTALSYNVHAQDIIPAPSEKSGSSELNIKLISNIYSKDKEFNTDIQVFNSYLKKMGFPILLIKESKANCVILEFDKKMKDEEYTFEISPANNIKIKGKSSGIFYGLMSLLQLRNTATISSYSSIHDYPAFQWRGMHLDVSRHYFPTDFIKKYIDLLALHKFNTFHWHLTDDQGWRIEIKKYPLLTTVGSKRHETIVDKNFEPYIGDGKPVEGFYTQDEIKDIVKYATDRHINVVPEIEMPGHAMAALAAYPQYSCNRTPLDVMTKWGVSDDVYCTKDSTFTFIKNILDEVMKLFPSKYIHIGGDEVPKTRWKRCEICQENIKKNNLKDEHELQSYFIKKIDTYVTSKGRSIIGWDEILEGGLAPNAAVMSWRGEEGGIEASKQKHHVVMSPGTHCYYDHYQGNRTTEPLAIGGFTPIEKVYSYDPIPEQLNQEQASYIMGAQANVWTEYIATPEHVEYMILPRMCALSEVLWTGKSKPGFEDFKIRLKYHFSFLDKWNVYYARSVYDITPSLKVNNGSLEVSLTSNYNDGNIYYALDGLSPDTSMTTYTKDAPILIDGSTTIKAQYFENGEPMGHEYSQDFIIHNGIGKTITSTPEPSKYYNKGGMPKLLDGIAGKTPRYSDEWLGWSGENPFILIDLGEDKLLNSLSLYTLQEENNWIYLPEKIDIEVGTTMKNFISAKTFSKMEIESNYKENSPLDMRFDNMILGRYIRILLKCAPKIPAGKPGQGENAWLFLSEISID